MGGPAHLVPFFGNLGLSEITHGKIHADRLHRQQEAIAKRGKPARLRELHLAVL